MNTELLFSSFPFISCEKVTLSRMTDVNLEALWDIMSDDENYRYSPTGAVQNKREVMAKIRRIDSLFREQKLIMLGIFHNDSLNKLIGTMQISKINKQIHSVSIDFMLNRAYSGRGLAAAAVDATVKYLFEHVNVNRIEAYAMPTNRRCEYLLERCGFTKEGIIREAFLWPDKGLVDLALYSILNSDYQRTHYRKDFTSHKF